MIYFIQGVYFRDRDTTIPSKTGITRAVDKDVTAFVYAGVIETFPALQRPAGTILDDLGLATLEDIIFDGTELRFTKRYPRREPIHFELRTTGSNMYVGSYSGKNIRRAFTRCIFNKVAESFFEPLPAKFWK